MLGKQWVNRYLRRSGKSVVERCGDRQRKCNGLAKWRLDLFIEVLPVMLQIALFLLFCALCKYMLTINTPVARVLIALTILGVVFYLGIIIAGTSSYGCPFQTPGSFALRRLWTIIGPSLNPAILPMVTALRSLRGILRRIPHVIFRFSHNIRHRFRTLLDRVQPSVLRIALRLPWTGLTIRPHHPHLPMIHQHSQSPITWLTQEILVTIQIASTNDVLCVSWILWNITDPEALNAAIRLAGNIRWFEDGTGVDPPYEIVVSIFRGCFGSNGEVYSGSRDRAYYSGQAILWIHTLSLRKSQEVADRYPLPTIRYSAPAHDHDLTHLIDINATSFTDNRFVRLLSINPGHSPSHLRWVSKVLLHFSWANRAAPGFNWTQWQISRAETTIPLDAMLNRFLTWCTFLGFPPEEEALKVQDKSYDISSLFSNATDTMFHQ